MKKALLMTLALLTVMAMLFAGPATPVAAKSGETSITLLYAQYIPNKGVTFKFKVHGDFQDFTGFVVINGHEYGLNCKLNEDDYLSCTADQGLKNYVDDIATIYLNGYTFTAPIRGASTPAQYCYPIFDEVNEGQGGSDEQPMLFISIPEETPWEQAGTYCQNAPANVGDEIYWYNPAWDGWYDYVYSLDGQDRFTTPPNMGPGYYWDFGSIPE